MTRSLKVVEELGAHLRGIMTKQSLSPRAALALQKDMQYLEKCASMLTSQDSNAINDLWREVQYLSRFFGEGYAEGDDQYRLQKLMDDFETALLEEIVLLRSTVP
jgi:hypothetical protein